MALVINKIKSFRWSVEFEYPDDDEFVQVKFKAIFKRMPQKYITKMAKLATPKIDKNGQEIPSDFDPSTMADEILIGWEEVNQEDENGEEVPLEFNKENKEAFLQIPMMTSFLVMSYYEGITGNKLKNSKGQ